MVPGGAGWYRVILLEGEGKYARQGIEVFDGRTGGEGG